MNYTTIEQSKELLRIGLGRNSADLRYETARHDGGVTQTYVVLGAPIHGNDIPCWSAGQLIDIFNKCNTNYLNDFVHITNMKSAMEHIYSLIIHANKRGELNFNRW